MLRSGRYALALGIGLAAAAGCALQGSDEVSDTSAIRELERRAVGRAQDYPADRITAAQEADLAKSKKKRRELGWKTLAKILEPVPIAEQKNIDAGIRPQLEIPLFRTWLGGDEIERMFVKMFSDFGKAKRQARYVPSDAEVKALFDWNGQSLGINSEAEYFKRLKLVVGRQGVDGLGGDARSAFSPGYVKQYLQDYDAITKCNGKLGQFTWKTPPTSDANFTNCLSHEFAEDAAVVKMSWRRNDDDAHGIPIIDTSAAKLKQRISGALDNGGWNMADADVQDIVPPSDAYTVELSDHAKYALAGFHVMTKELRHWIWVTAWWSPKGKANEDFGQDRPASFTGVWANYKMNIVTDFDEGDPDPRGGFTGSLGDALAAVHGAQTWSSNGFIERGDHNAQTNCMGCHQHAGDVNALTNVLTDANVYKNFGRSKIREGFPVDYSWAFETPPSPDTNERLFEMLLGHVKAYDDDDKRTP